MASFRVLYLAILAFLLLYILTVEVLDTPSTIRADQAETLYKVISNVEKKEEEWI